jgi:hypothetical protein
VDGSDVDVREEALWLLLSASQWTTTAKLADQICTYRAFRDRHGSSLPQASLRKAVRRAVQVLVEAGKAEVRKSEGVFKQLHYEVRRVTIPSKSADKERGQQRARTDPGRASEFLATSADARRVTTSHVMTERGSAHASKIVSLGDVRDGSA